jgi:5-methylcytosine-specific restriction endonuclease McrA
MEHTLVLNASYEPVNIVSWKRALTLLYQGKVEVLAEYDREIHSISVTVKLPSVLRLLRYVKIRRRFQHIKFCRENIYARDHYTCQYCGAKSSSDHLTFDHVIPVVKGGGKSWDNIVTCCIACNNKKGGRTPAEAGMRLIRQPREPDWARGIVHITIGFKRPPEAWYEYLLFKVDFEANTLSKT